MAIYSVSVNSIASGVRSEGKEHITGSETEKVLVLKEMKTTANSTSLFVGSVGLV